MSTRVSYGIAASLVAVWLFLLISALVGGFALAPLALTLLVVTGVGCLGSAAVIVLEERK